jgi:glycine dehydrogenase subunit 2
LAYITVHGQEGLPDVARHAVLNARWLKHRLAPILPAAFAGPCMHEATLTATPLKQATGARALDVAKRLMEEGFHAPTVYFPLIVDEALMFEPTETESPQTLEALASSLEMIFAEAHDDVSNLHDAPRTTPVRRVDEARAARQLVPTEDAATR